MTKARKSREWILIVDDDPDVTDMISLALSREGYRCEVCNSPTQVLTHLNGNSEKQFMLVLLDILMPSMSGMDVLEQIQMNHSEIGVMMISADKNLAQAIEAMRKGALDFISKPFQPELVVPRIEKALERVRLEQENRNYQKYLEDKVETRTDALFEKHRSLQKLYISTVEAIVRAIEAKDPYTVGHSKRVSRYCSRMAEKMGVNSSDIHDIEVAGLLHDVGKIGVSDAILTKPSRLTIEEYESIKEHPLISLKIIDPIQELKKVKEYVKHHHEKWDGTGYPDGLKGDKIPLGARVLSVADAFDTMWIGRQYHASWNLETVVQEFQKNKGSQFDPMVVDAFVELIHEDQPTFDLIREENPPRFSEPKTIPSKT